MLHAIANIAFELVIWFSLGVLAEQLWRRRDKIRSALTKRG